MFSFSPKLNSTSKYPLYMQLYNYIVNELRNGNLVKGDKLPSKRKLAKDLGVSLNTIDSAYQLLLSEGYIESIERKGFFVSNIEVNISNINEVNSERKEIIEEEKNKWIYDLRTANIDTETFPKSIWNKLYRKTLSSENELLNLGRKQGELELCTEIAKYLYEFRGVNCKPEQIIIGAGMEYLMSLLAGLFRGSSFALENPGYPKTMEILNNQDLTYEFIPLDKYGMSSKYLEQSGTNICYLTPSHQFPSGITMPIKRRFEILNWANKSNDRYIIEDDYDSEFRYDRLPIPSLQGLDKNNKVIYMSTFSRSLAPGIRIAYMVLPETLLSIFNDKFKFYSSTVSRFEQITLAKFIKDGYYSRHLNRIRKKYKTRRDILKKELLETFGDKIKIYGEHTGLHLLVELITDKSEEELVATAKKNNINLNGISFYNLEKNHIGPNPLIIFGFGGLEEKVIKEVIQKLGVIWKN